MSAAKRNRGGVGKWFKWGVLAAVVMTAFEIGRSYTYNPGHNIPAERVTVRRGASIGAISSSLEETHAIRHARLFRLYASIGGRDRLIKPGTYDFIAGEGWQRVLDALVEGKGVVHSVTIPEGYDLRQITPLLAKTLGVPEDSIEAAVADTAWQRTLDIPLKSLEGYLFPATYSFAEGTNAREAVKTMVEAFEAAWKKIPNAADRLQALAITKHDAITMASIIETEAKRPEERVIISAVYWNRVKKGMKLQADPTVQYALPAHVARVFYKDLEVDSKFNTYKYAGLPPGPIASPGLASIEAALNPASVPYLYFVAHPDGHHEFRATGAEHEQAKAMMKRERAKAAAATKPAGSGTTAPKTPATKPAASPPKKP